MDWWSCLSRRPRIVRRPCKSKGRTKFYDDLECDGYAYAPDERCGRGSTPRRSTSLENLMSIIGVLWLILIVLKALGVALTTASWFWVIVWPIVPIVILILVGIIFGVSARVLRGF